MVTVFSKSCRKMTAIIWAGLPKFKCYKNMQLFSDGTNLNIDRILTLWPWIYNSLLVRIILVFVLHLFILVLYIYLFSDPFSFQWHTKTRQILTIFSLVVLSSCIRPVRSTWKVMHISLYDYHEIIEGKRIPHLPSEIEWYIYLITERKLKADM